MYFIYVIIAISIAFSIAMLYFEKKKQYLSKFICKTLASLFFVLAAFFSLLITSKFELIYLMIAEALVLCMLGDIFLSIEDIAKDIDIRVIELLGLVFFLLGHFAFLLSFIFLVNTFNYLLLIIVFLLPVAVIVLQQIKLIDLKKLKLPVCVYAAIIGSMLATAVNVFLSEISTTSILILIAAIIFVLSDVSLLFYNFGKNKKFALKIGCIIPYYIAQCMFALLILY